MLYRVVLTYESEINLKSSSFLYCRSFFKIVISFFNISLGRDKFKVAP